MTFDATPDLRAGTALATRPHEAVDALRDAVERLRGAAWIDVEWQDVSRAAVPLVRKMVVRGPIEEDVEAALAAVVAMVARRALQVCADRAARRSAPC